MFWNTFVVEIALRESSHRNDLPSRSLSVAEAEILATVLGDLGEGAVLRIEGLCEQTLPTFKALLSSSSFRYWVVGAPDDVRRLLCYSFGACKLARATLLVAPGFDPDATRELTHRLFDQGALVEVRLSNVGGASSTDALLSVDDVAVWRVLQPDERDDYLPSPIFSIGVDGRARRLSSEESAVTSAPVTTIGIEATLRELGLSRSDLVGTWPHRPLHVAFPRAGGGVRRIYWLGGSQALGHSLTQAEAQAAFGFDDDGEYQRWLEEVARDSNLADSFPTFPGCVQTSGVFIEAEQRRIVKPATDRRSVVVLASWLARGDRENARSFVGLQQGFFDIAEKDDLARLDQQELRRFVEFAAASLSKAVVVLVRSRVPADKRRRAVEALTFLGSPRARDAAKYLVLAAPEIAGQALKRFGNRAARARIDRAKDPQLALRFLDETVHRLCDVFVPETGSRQARL